MVDIRLNNNTQFEVIKNRDEWIDLKEEGALYVDGYDNVFLAVSGACLYFGKPHRFEKSISVEKEPLLYPIRPCPNDLELIIRQNRNTRSPDE